MTFARRTPAGPPEVGSSTTLAYTGSTFHRLDCPRIARASGARVTYAARAVTNRVPCPVCLPHGVKVIAARATAYSGGFPPL